MPPMGTMPLHGDASRLGALASFVSAWTVMMAAMMLPSLAPTLWRHRRAVAARRLSSPGRHTVTVAVGYFALWTAAGVAVFLLAGALAAAASRLPALARAMPLAAGAVVLVAGATQLTPWKARHLARWREASAPDRTAPADAVPAWRLGIRLGVRCGLSCAGPMAILLAIGVMDPRAMAVATLAISAERLAPDGVRIARATGLLAVGAGLLLLGRAAGAG